MRSKINIFLADDHQMLLDGLSAVLQTQPHFNIVGTALNGIDLLSKAASAKTHVLVMDINMPQKDGLSVLREHAGSDIDFKVIILSSYDELRLIREVMKLGANGYLTKQCAADSIIDAIDTVARGEEYFCESVQQTIVSRFTQKNPQINTGVSAFALNLTDRELDVLRLLSLEYSTREISEELFISVHTVESHRKNLLKKLDVKSTVGLAMYAYKNQILIP